MYIYTCTFFVLFRAPLQQFTKSTHNPGPQTTTSMYFRRSQSALPQQNDHHHHPHQTYPSQPPQHAPYPSPSSSSPPNPFLSQGEHTSSPVVICHDSDDDDDDSRQGSSAFLTTYPPGLGSSYLTTPPPDLGFTGTASTAHPLVDVQEQQPHPTPRDGGYPDDTERLSLEWLSDQGPLPPRQRPRTANPTLCNSFGPFTNGWGQCPLRVQPAESLSVAPDASTPGGRSAGCPSPVPSSRCRNFTPLVTRPSSQRLSLLWIKGAGLDRPQSHLAPAHRHKVH